MVVRGEGKKISAQVKKFNLPNQQHQFPHSQMDPPPTAANAGSLARQEKRRKDYLVGIFLLLSVVLLWTGESSMTPFSAFSFIPLTLPSFSSFFKLQTS